MLKRRVRKILEKKLDDVNDDTLLGECVFSRMSDLNNFLFLVVSYIIIMDYLIFFSLLLYHTA